jgi:hypothetical protein
VKISSLIISLAVVGLFLSIISLFISHATTVYNGNTFNQSEYYAYNKFTELNTLAGDLNQSVTKTTSGSSVDVLSGFLSSGWTGIKSTFVSFDILTSLITSGTSSLSGSIGLTDPTTGINYFQNAILLVAFITFIFAVISVLVRYPI